MAEDASNTFGDYHLVEKIATGGMAEVWKARAFGLAGFEKTLVIKKILDTLAEDEEFERLFIDEARIAVLLQHVNIVQVFDLGKVDGSLYMAMEYVAGLDLARLIKRARRQGPVPIPLALFIAGEVLKALRFAHERADDSGTPLGLIHCDISPQNVLISHSGEVKITDFGISRAAFQAKSLHEVVRGKYAYMSPEQIENQTLDGRTDIFSLGILLWELITGKRLFKARTRDETLARVRRADVPSLRTYRDEVSDAVEGFVLQALSREPDARFDSAAEMIEALGALWAREGHRANSHDLAAWVKQTLAASEAVPPVVGDARSIVVLSAEAYGVGPLDEDPGVLRELVADWADVLLRAGAQIWEQQGRSLLAVWVVDDRLAPVFGVASDAAHALWTASRHSGFQMAAGLAPGHASILRATSRPDVGWELAGPFYLARWMMNLSAHRGHVLTTGVGRRAVAHRSASEVGGISMPGEQVLHVYALQ